MRSRKGKGRDGKEMCVCLWGLMGWLGLEEEREGVGSEINLIVGNSIRCV